MARGRTRAVELARLLDAASQPIYLLDDEQTIIFCNQACLDWIACTSDQMRGLRSAYHSNSEVTGPEAMAAGLCPPPAAMVGRQRSGTIEIVAEDGRISRRRAEFVPLDGGPDEITGLLVMVDPGDLSEADSPPPAAEESEAARLHRRIQSFRRQAAIRYGADRLVGDSPAMRRARAQVELAVSSGASVLIIGPPGSGRQHVAGAIHYGREPESTGSMIPLACSVLGAELIHSTISALASREAPDRGVGQGTILLNDADRLPLEIQAELATTLAAGAFLLQQIATARVPLADLARQGKYRADLASALSTIVIELPPLAERREDLPMLAQLFVEDANLGSNKQVAGLSSEALDRLDGYPWPGNVDELARMVAEAHERTEAFQITPADLPDRIHLAAADAAYPAVAEETIVLDQFLGRIERELISRAMARTRGNKTKAAKLLGMTRPRLYRRLVQIGLEPRGEGTGSRE